MPEYRLRFNKGNQLKYLSHLELIKIIERAIRRGQLPVVYSGGFHPHPELSFGPALAVGISSTDEYFDVELAQPYEPDQILSVLNRVLPDGIKITAVKQIKHHIKPLNAVINRAAYLIQIQADPEAMVGVTAWLNGLMGLTEINFLRRSKNGQKMVNIRPWLHNLKTETINQNTLQINLAGENGSGGNLRPEDIVGNIPQPVEVLNITRIGLWNEEKGLVRKPLEFCEKPEGNG
jgi:radical SAM-linked protein